MQRAPLRDLPLEHFTNPVGFSPTSPHSGATTSRPSKRPLSPGTPKPYSPAKRRILSAEGLLPAPQKLSKDSPPQLPRITLSQTSPVTNAQSMSSSDYTQELHHESASASLGPHFNASSRPPSPSAPELSSHPQETSPDASFNSASPKTSSAQNSMYVVVPREPPPSIDPGSIHYPGFHVHQDPYLYTPNPQYKGWETLRNNIDQPLAMEEGDSQESKENCQPPRKKSEKVRKVDVLGSTSPRRSSRLLGKQLVAQSSGTTLMERLLASGLGGDSDTLPEPVGHLISPPRMPKHPSPLRSSVESRRVLRRVMEEEADTNEMEIDAQ
ncbi:hypothetical protein AX16_007223 [Volvariella volvacea WC 439]|nr:hypothetical protein AX16_007223 [Volvariella volvacea WC 439]